MCLVFVFNTLQLNVFENVWILNPIKSQLAQKMIKGPRGVDLNPFSYNSKFCYAVLWDSARCCVLYCDGGLNQKGDSHVNPVHC